VPVTRSLRNGAGNAAGSAGNRSLEISLQKKLFQAVADLEEIRELLRMGAIQTAENVKQLGKHAKEWRQELREPKEEHDCEMKEGRTLFKKMIERIAV
jgi:hypothetical protein